jgi:serine/threonine-protein kinase
MTTLGKYRLEQRLGGGGMAEVFVGSTVGAEGFSRRIAVKRVLPGYSENPAFAQMFISEARISSRLVHPNIVSVLDFDRDPEQRLFLVMELVEGRDLDQLSASGLLPFPVLIYVMAEILRGLGFAHDLPVQTGDPTRRDTMQGMRGVVHRDVSPHNVLLSWEGVVKVSDFGIAKARAASSATASVFIKGKPAYMSPEQANGEALDGRSDLFAVGVMLWEMLTGRRLFVGEDTRSTLASVLFGQIPRPRSVRGDVPKDLERVVMQLLERDLPARYQSAELAIDDLLGCADAPKDGRAVLAKTLAERFPDQAPVRGSVLRARGGTPPGAAPGVTPLPPDVPTIADGHAGRQRAAAAIPSIGEARGAATGTMHGRRKGKLIALVGVAFLATGLVAFGIVSAVTGKVKATDKPGSAVEPPPAGSGSAPVASVAPATVADAGMPDAAVTAVAPPADAPSGAVQKDASSIAQAHPEAEKRFGTLHVEAYPVVTVYVDKKKYGETSQTISLPVGKHTVRLVNVDLHKDETVIVTITENQTQELKRE